jgi:hypothetical protein
MDAAACRNADPDIFFDGDRSKEAIAICIGCPVWAECTLANVDEPWGVWGCSERSRVRMRKLRRNGGTAAQLLNLAHRANLHHVRGVTEQMIDTSRLVTARATSYA